MAKPAIASTHTQTKNSPLMVRLDPESKKALVAAAELKGLSISDYVRSVTVAQARKEIEQARAQRILMSAEDQLAFWQALNAPVKLTPAQKRLGRLMQGKQ